MTNSQPKNKPNLDKSLSPAQKLDNSQDDLLKFIDDPKNIAKAVEGSMEKRLKVMDSQDELDEILDGVVCYGTGYGSPDEITPEQARVRIKRLLLQERIHELEQTHKYIDDTVMFLTNDLPSLLEQEHVFEIRKQHKAELHRNLDERIVTLTAQLNETGEAK